MLLRLLDTDRQVVVVESGVVVAKMLMIVVVVIVCCTYESVGGDRKEEAEIRTRTRENPQRNPSSHSQKPSLLLLDCLCVFLVREQVNLL